MHVPRVRRGGFGGIGSHPFLDYERYVDGIPLIYTAVHDETVQSGIECHNAYYTGNNDVHVVVRAAPIGYLIFDESIDRLTRQVYSGIILGIMAMPHDMWYYPLYWIDVFNSLSVRSESEHMVVYY